MVVCLLRVVIFTAFFFDFKFYFFFLRRTVKRISFRLAFCSIKNHIFDGHLIDPCDSVTLRIKVRIVSPCFCQQRTFMFCNLSFLVYYLKLKFFVLAFTLTSFFLSLFYHNFHRKYLSKKSLILINL